MLPDFLLNNADVFNIDAFSQKRYYFAHK